MGIIWIHSQKKFIYYFSLVLSRFLNKMKIDDIYVIFELNLKLVHFFVV